jgi:hypothetical protein
VKKEVTKAEKEPQLVESAGWKQGVRLLIYLSCGSSIIGLIMTFASTKGSVELMIVSNGTLFYLLLIEGMTILYLSIFKGHIYPLVASLIKAISAFSVMFILMYSLFHLLAFPGQIEISNVAKFLCMLTLCLVVIFSNKTEQIFFGEDRFFVMEIVPPLLFSILNTLLSGYQMNVIVR